jgi:hypothetical protein
MNALSEALADEAQPRDPRMRGFRDRPLHIELKDRFRAARAFLSQPPPAVAVLVGSVDATSADVIAVAVTRHAEVNRYGLFYDATVDDDAKKSDKWDQLRAAGIVVR